MERLGIDQAHALLMGDEGEAPRDSGAVSENEAAAAEALEGALDAAERQLPKDSVGLGVDIVEIERMCSILERTPSFARRVFSRAEQDYCEGTANPATHYALRFAAKEAVVKALGTGIAQGIDVLDIEVKRADNGRPSILLSGRALEIAQEQGIRDISISLSYTHTDAVACAMAVTSASIKASEKRKDPMEELSRQFKETRGILDEL